jgi:hypothetical protein
MTTNLGVEHVVLPVAPSPGLPCLGAVVAHTVVSLLIAVVAPAVLISVTLLALNIEAAVLVALAWMAGAMCWRWASGRPMSWLILLALGMMTIKTVFTLATGNTFVYFVQPVFTDAVVASAFLVSLGTGRPIVARIAPDFYPVDAAIAARPGIQRLFRRLTRLWGLVIVAKGSLTLWLLLSQSVETFVLVKSISMLTFNVVAVAVTIGAAAVVARKEGLMGPALATD